MPFTIKKIAMRLRNDSEYIPLPGVRGEAGPGVPAGGTTGQVLAKTSSTDYATGWVDAGSSSSLTILSYGHSTWSDFIAAYNSRSIVYCRASSDSDPASGSQTRLAFMAYVNSAASPTSVEFQYYRSVSSHTDAQQGDQVFIYKLTSAGAWTVTVRDAFTKIVAGTNMTSSYSSGTLTLNATGGGGGTSDYDDLADKPSINDVTLSGNKTAAELGLGTYSKPSGGIPKTDLASTVQTSLGLADSALQSVPSTYRTAAAQDAIDAAQDAQIESISRRNLLDNWYFVGGGSQKDDGVFPINQRGQTIYWGKTPTIDRWNNNSAACKLTVENECLHMANNSDSASTATQFIEQKPNIPLPAGTPITFSAIVKGYARIGIDVGSATYSKEYTDYADYTLATVSGVVTEGDTVNRVYVQTINKGEFFVKAVKLELSSYQTLAHQENGNWVLNELPNFGEELAKCQRYYIKFDRYIASGFLTNSGKEYNIPIYLPITMAGTPTVTMSGYVARTPNGYSAHTGGSWTAPTTLGVYYPNNGFVLLADTIASAVDTNNIQINYFIKDLVLTV